MNTKFLGAFIAFACCVYSLSGQVPKGQIIFSSRQNDTAFNELYVINSDGTHEKKITSVNSKYKDLPSVFRNQIVYRQYEDRQFQTASLYITNIDGHNPKAIIENKIVCYPRWKHDGSLIAYEFYSGDNPQEIWVVDSCGKNNHKLISNALHPCWSYDNKFMLFTRDNEIWMLGLKKGSEQRLTKKQDTVARFPAISPDGRLFAYYAEFAGKMGIIIADLKNNKVKKFIPNCGDVFFWTDDPKYIITGCEPTELYLLDVTTGAKIPVTTNNRRNFFPCWANTKK